jgi:hypothetical protein
MVSDLKCPECGDAIHPCSYDNHLIKCLYKRAERAEFQASEYGKMLDERDHELSEATALLRELYGFSRSAARSGERLWCGCESCNKLEERIKKILEL